ncbi:RNA polymerase sigma24 factor [Spirilliplanes yamanashiensis]|uniref:RNA polymerase sigma24 factor n=2 Tax=Spirilliplanes yamanashiensis TaxID=42233 RepID=A0A8J3Y9P2_9ACTN|nr:RNA polymerase sigma24 factor [Spirilliplanes yamanashiensis]
MVSTAAAARCPVAGRVRQDSPQPSGSPARVVGMALTTDLHPPPETTRAVPDFDELYAAHYADLTVQLFAYFGDRQEAQDVVQEAFCRALARWSSVSRYDDPVAWVRRVAWNLAVSRWRRARTALGFLRRQRVAEPQVDGPSPERVALVRALATLPGVQRRAMVLHYLADLTVAEIAQREGVAEGTVKSWLHRGRAALAVQLRPTGTEVSRG